jgi:hypothetical protein
MTFATNANLLDYQADIFDHGIDDFTAELAKAQYDVARRLETDWWNVERNSRSRGINLTTGGQFDINKLTASQWTRCTVFRALSAYIYPKLSTWRPEGDAFREQLAFYQARFSEEIVQEMAVGVQYDFNDDGTTQANERVQTQQNRLYI